MNFIHQKHVDKGTSQPAFTCSKLTIETVEPRCEIWAKLTTNTPNFLNCCSQHIFNIMQKALAHPLPEDWPHATMSSPILENPKFSKIEGVRLFSNCWCQPSVIVCPWHLLMRFVKYIACFNRKCWCPAQGFSSKSHNIIVFEIFHHLSTSSPYSKQIWFVSKLKIYIILFGGTNANAFNMRICNKNLWSFQ